jgi:hypothetical protein
MTPKQWEDLLNHLREGESVVSWCKSNGVGRWAIYEGLEKNPELADRYARAKQIGVEARLDAARELAKSEPDVNRARLIVDLDKWEASKLLPKKYGDRQTIALEDVSAETLLDALRKESK